MSVAAAIAKDKAYVIDFCQIHSPIWIDGTDTDFIKSESKIYVNSKII